MISDGYRKEQQLLHINPDYGVASKVYAPLVSQMIARLGVSELLDYGAGKGRLMEALKVPHKLTVQCYDPAIPEWSEPAVPMQMCACIDVLEHVEPEHLDSVLDDLKRVTGVVGFFSVHTEPAEKTLSDGRNAHLIQQPPEWWWEKISARFEVQTFQRMPLGAYFIVYAKPSPLIEVEKNGNQHLCGTKDRDHELEQTGRPVILPR